MSAPSTLDTARTKVLERGEGLSEAEIFEVLSIDDEHLTELLDAHLSENHRRETVLRQRN